MPWVVSLSLHVAILIILFFVVLVAKYVVLPAAPPTDTTFINAPPNAKLKNRGAGPNALKAGSPGNNTVNAQAWKGREGPVDGKDTKVGRGWGPSMASGTTVAYGFGSGGGGGAGGSDDFGMGKGDGGFFGAGPGGNGGGGSGDAAYVIFALDHSGSVLTSFDEIVAELKKEVFKLTEEQMFHVVFFAKDTYEENTSKRLVAATESNKRILLNYVKDVRAAGFGSSPIPALKAAFKAFKGAPDNRGRIMYLLTDGEFDSSGETYQNLSGTEAVLAWLRDNNRDKAVHIYPIILGNKPSEEVEASMKKLAAENGGEYTFVERKE